MVDVFPKKLEGEGMDYSHSSVFIGDPKIEYDTGNIFIETGNRFIEYTLVKKIVDLYVHVQRDYVHTDCSRNFIVYKNMYKFNCSLIYNNYFYSYLKTKIFLL